MKNSNFTQVVKIRPEKDFEIMVDQNGLLNYESKKWLYVLTRPLMWILTGWVVFKKRILGIKPKINTLWFDGLSIPCRQVKVGAGSWRALDLIYNFNFGVDGRLSDYWFRILNAQAVRNRLKLVKQKLTEVIEDLRTKKKKIRLLSIASGSAQAIIEVMEKFKDADVELQVNVIDLDPTAIDFSQQLAKRHGIKNGITFTCGNLYRYLEKLNENNNRPDIIEMVGFLDYRPNYKAGHLLGKIHKLLLPGGIFITANICPNAEKHFLTNVIDWPMIYRTPEELGNILLEAGFEDCRIICEPLKIFAVGVCKKLLDS